MQSLTRETLKIFWQHAKKYKWHIAALVVFNFFVLAQTTYIPILYRNLIDSLNKGDAHFDLTPVVGIVTTILIANIIGSFARRAVNFSNNYFQSNVMANLTNTCFQYLQQHSYGFFTSKFVGSLVTKVKRYEKAFETVAQQVSYELGRTLFETIVVIGILLYLYPTFGLILLVWCVAYLLFSFFYARLRMPYDLERSKADTHTTAQLADSITNNVNIKSFTGYEKENKHFASVTREQARLRKRSWDLGSLGDAVQGLAMIATEFFVIYLAVHAWQQGTLSVGGVVLIQSYFLRVFDKLWDASSNIRQIYESLSDANEMTEMLMQPHAIQDAKNAKVISSIKGSVEFKNVTFGYHKDASILKNFNLAIKPGERVALIGPSGGGKSTILKLLMRFYDVTGGEILIDGHSVASATQDSVRAAISLVPQDPILFHRTLADNIRYAKPAATDEEVINAAKLAHAHEFIEKSQHGYKTLVGERGIKLSGGERQRVAIARAILKDAPILILDEATSSLDSESEMFIQDALRNLMQGRTTIVVAHRLSTIMQMDRIVVISDGAIIEEGKHEELLKAQQGTYQKLWSIQAGGFSGA